MPSYIRQQITYLSFSPAHGESFRTQHHFYLILKPPNSSSRLSLISFTDLLRLRSPGLPLLSRSVWFSVTVLGEMSCNTLTSWRDVTVSTILPLLSQLLQHIKLLSPRPNDFFCCQVKRDASAEGISVERLVLQGLSLTVFLNAPSALTF